MKDLISRSNLKKIDPAAEKLKATQPMSIYFNTTLLEGQNDYPYSCYSVGQKVVFGADPNTSVQCTTPDNENCYLYCTEEDIQTAELSQFIQNNILNLAQNYLQQLFSVASDGPQSVGLNPGYPTCRDNIPLPSQYMSPRGSLPSGINTIIYVLARPILQNANISDSTLANGGPCNFDVYFQEKGSSTIIGLGRPKVVTINLNPSMISSFIGSTAFQTTALYKLVLHEIFHGLGFTDIYFRYYLAYTSSGSQIDNNAIATFTYDGYNANSQNFTDTREGLTMELVSQAFSSQFGCYPNANEGYTQYSPLYYFSELGGDSSHWAANVFYDEIMMPFSNPNSVVSNLTLAVFNSFFFYNVNYQMAEQMEWGRNMGCEFIAQCSSQNWRSYFSSPYSQNQMCTGSRYGKGISNVVEYYEDLPTEYQYFTTPTWGGDRYYLDYCPVYLTFTDYCTDESLPVNTTIREQRCSNCRCFEYLEDSNQPVEDLSLACWPASCSSTGQLSILANGQEIICNTPGEIVAVGDIGVLCPVDYDFCTPTSIPFNPTPVPTVPPVLPCNLDDNCGQTASGSATASTVTSSGLTEDTSTSTSTSSTPTGDSTTYVPLTVTTGSNTQISVLSSLSVTVSVSTSNPCSKFYASTGFIAGGEPGPFICSGIKSSLISPTLIILLFIFTFLIYIQ
ncbi:peptidase M8 [Tieghemostelium lacteum]|uniref:Peptidase M8 n=1 Tax=Tieghemostelium lacteum TaxID=361077 RepID=A0A151ZAP9_TIELA|nr:peptidase M8 [Tieghemostelium lacteum]|eukprot:KYQ91011.1 peptidase M8 [Tieghemostelium lacteum]